MIFVNKSGPDAKENLARFATTVRLLPEYMQFKWIEDDEGHKIKEKDNATERRHPVTQNRIIIKASANSLDSALKLARGLTTAIQHFDEPEFTSYIKVIVENSVSTYETAARRAKENHSMYGRLFTCTPKLSLGVLGGNSYGKTSLIAGINSLSLNYQLNMVA